jgi:hypothetical protein
VHSALRLSLLVRRGGCSISVPDGTVLIQVLRSNEKAVIALLAARWAGLLTSNSESQS